MRDLMTLIGRSVAIAALSAATLPSQAAVVRYQVIDLGVALFQPVDRSVPAVSDGRFIAGTNTFPSTTGYLWSNGSASLIAPNVAGTYSFAYDVSSSGAVVGITPGPGLNGPFGRPYIYQNGVLTLIPDLGFAPSVNVRAAYGINDAGVVVGEWERQAFIYENGIIRPLATPVDALGFQGATTALDINNGGVAVGYASFPSSLAALLWSGDTVTDIGTLPLNSGQRREARANAINDAGQVVGWSRTSLADGRTVVHGFLWQNGSMVDLGTLRGPEWTSQALAINDLGAAVGQSNCISNFGDCAFLWTAAEGMLNLNDYIDPLAGWRLNTATGINDLGWIVGNGLLDGAPRDYLLLPLAVPPPPDGSVSEPPMLALLAIGLIGAAVVRRTVA
jgi:probable HAF family extracellular repeat protein